MTKPARAAMNGGNNVVDGSTCPEWGRAKGLTNLLRRDVIPYWGTKSIHEIKKRDVSDLASVIAQRVSARRRASAQIESCRRNPRGAPGPGD
jgi:hypothetical protein